MSEPETRTAFLNWLPPIAVNVQHIDDLPTTVRDVGHRCVTQVAELRGHAGADRRPRGGHGDP
jgi:hypothetical protein